MNEYEWPTKLTKKKDGKHFMEEEKEKLPGNCETSINGDISCETSRKLLLNKHDTYNCLGPNRSFSHLIVHFIIYP